MDILNEAKQVFNSEIEELIKVRDKIDNSINDVLRELVATKGKVVVTGIGKSGIIGKKISATLASTGTESVFMNAAEGLHGDLGIIKKDDIVIAISNSGNTDEINLIIPVRKKIGCKIIALTGGKNSKLFSANYGAKIMYAFISSATYATLQSTSYGGTVEKIG